MITAPQIDKIAVDTDGKLVARLSKLLLLGASLISMAQTIELIFFRGGWCHCCNLNFSELRLAKQQLRDISMSGSSASISWSCYWSA